MANYVIPAIGDDIPSTQLGINKALSLAAAHGCELVLLAPGVNAAKDSNILEQILGTAVLKALTVKRESIKINGVTVRLESLLTFKGAQLSNFNGVILGLWTSKHDAVTLSASNPQAKEVLLIQWIEDELKQWATYNNAIYI